MHHDTRGGAINRLLASEVQRRHVMQYRSTPSSSWTRRGGNVVETLSP